LFVKYSNLIVILIDSNTSKIQFAYFSLQSLLRN